MAKRRDRRPCDREAVAVSEWSTLEKNGPRPQKSTNPDRPRSQLIGVRDPDVLARVRMMLIVAGRHKPIVQLLGQRLL
jgi:hypothetical protein